MWRVHKAAGRPWPDLCEDDVVNYMVMEAVALRVLKEDNEQAKKEEHQAWKDDLSELKEAVGG